MVLRELYLNQLIKFKDKDIVKIISGIRRCGKSTLLVQYRDYLLKNGVKQSQIIFINLESAQFDNIREYHDLYNFIQKKIKSTDKKYYVFIDEIQNVLNFERAVNSFSVDFDVDLYLTGSNAYLLSSEISTLISGRYVEIKMLPFSFAEYCTLWENKSKEELFFQYMKYGGFPFISNSNDDDFINNYLEGIYNTVVVKDIIKRNSFNDFTMLENILKTLMSAIGSPVSANSICKILKNAGKSVSVDSVEKYMTAFCNAFIFNKVERYDLKGKQYLKTLQKYYVTDMGLRNFVLGYRQIEPTHALENIVYWELIRRGYHVDIGNINGTEIDFVARKNSIIEYYQVSYSVANNETLEREIRPFSITNDHYSRFLITMDRDFVNDINGVKKLWVVEWLCNYK
ncbi:MAG: ATP-binding protein [Bacteroidales bacterium]|nr:ATP-binding protein [Bacteroidales bacterium]